MRRREAYVRTLRTYVRRKEEIKGSEQKFLLSCTFLFFFDYRCKQLSSPHNAKLSLACKKHFVLPQRSLRTALVAARREALARLQETFFLRQSLRTALVAAQREALACLPLTIAANSSRRCTTRSSCSPARNTLFYSSFDDRCKQLSLPHNTKLSLACKKHRRLLQTALVAARRKALSSRRRSPRTTCPTLSLLLIKDSTHAVTACQTHSRRRSPGCKNTT